MPVSRALERDATFWLTIGSTILPHARGNIAPLFGAFLTGILAWALALPLLT